MNISSAYDGTTHLSVQSLSHEELIGKFLQLNSQHENLSKQYEVVRQELHDARKNNQFTSDLKDHLTAEVEAWQKNDVKVKKEFGEKIKVLQDEIEALTRAKLKENEDYINKIEILQSKVKTLEEANNGDKTFEEKSITHVNSTKICEELKRFEDENDSLKNIINQQNIKLSENDSVLELFKMQIKNLDEQVESLKCNLDSKRSELISVTELLHSVQEDLCVVNAELRQYKAPTNTHAVKGNSLFAEVDDKRQEMLKSYSQMKDKVQQLHRELLTKQAEIDSLLCEKKTLWDEYAGQASYHDAVLDRAYERRIIDLEKQNDQLHREIAHWYEKNLDTSSSEITQWVSGVLDYYRQENHRLSNEFAASSVDNLHKEQKLRDLQRQLVAWRTKATEANAAIAELEMKMKTSETLVNKNEKSIKNELYLSRVNENDASVIEYSMRKSSISGKENLSPKSNGNISPEKSKDVIMKPGILVSGSAKNKIAKKTTFI